MKLLFLILLFGLYLTSCNSAQEKTTQISETSANAKQVLDSNEWTNSFLKLSEAITHGDKTSVKSFIDFPIRNKENEIWFLADMKLVMEIDSKNIVPFTEADFDKYFSSIFSMDLRKTLEKINLDEFFKNHEATSPEIEVVKDSKSQLVVRYERQPGKVTLSLNSEFEGASFKVQYEFDITSTQQLKFRQVDITM